MMDFSAWGPTLATVVCWIFFGGIAYNKLQDHGKRLDGHDEILKEVEKHDTEQDVALAKLEAWRDGYNAAKVTIGGKQFHSS